MCTYRALHVYRAPCAYTGITRLLRYYAATRVHMSLGYYMFTHTMCVQVDCTSTRTPRALSVYTHPVPLCTLRVLLPAPPRKSLESRTGQVLHRTLVSTGLARGWPGTLISPGHTRKLEPSCCHFPLCLVWAVCYLFPLPSTPRAQWLGNQLTGRGPGKFTAGPAGPEAAPVAL